MTLFVNGRWVRDSSLTYAVTQAYHTLLQVGRFPIALIFITMPTDMVDVNVHPAKTEVRFRQPNAVFGAVQKAVRRTLVADSPIRDAGGWTVGANINVGAQNRDPIGWAGKIEQQRHAQAGMDLEWSGQSGTLPTSSSIDGTSPTDAPNQQPIPNLGGDKLPIMRVVGQVGAAYIITEGPDGMFLLDQHAAHERILYEKFMAERDRDGIASQQLMVGTAVNLSPPHATLLSDNLETLNQIGFVVEPFGPNAFMVRAIPAVISKLDPTRAITAVVEDLEQGDAPLQGKIEDKIILRVCKSAAVKAGQTLSAQEMEAMVQQLEACDSPHTCPHGRPTLIHLSVAQLAKQFGRI
jgi:DNA mismatch repair protein MutL